MTLSSGVVDTGVATTNAVGVIDAIVAAITAHPGYEYVERVTAAANVFTDVIKSLGSVNGDADWYLLIRYSGSTNFHFAVTEDYNPVTKSVRKYVHGNNIANSPDDGYTHTADKLVTDLFGASSLISSSVASPAYTSSQASWYVLVTDKYLFAIDYIFGAIDVPVESRWRRNLMQGRCLVGGAKVQATALRTAYGKGPSSGSQALQVASPAMSTNTNETGGGWLGTTYDVNLAKYPYAKVPVVSSASGQPFVGYLPNILWLPYVPATFDTANIDGELYRYLAGYCWHKVAAE